MSVQRVFAPVAVAREFAAALAAGANKLVVGHPTDAETEVGPLIRPGEVDRVHEWVTEAVDGGAELLSGGQPLDNHCYAPTVLFAPPADVQNVSRQEVFGPVVCVYPYDDVEAAVAQANDAAVCVPGRRVQPGHRSGRARISRSGLMHRPS